MTDALTPDNIVNNGVGFWASKTLERFPITWNGVIEKEPLKIKELEHVGIEKVEQLF